MLKGKGDLHNHLQRAPILVAEKDLLDGCFLDKDVPGIMEKMFPGVSCNEHNEPMISLVSANGELPLSFEEQFRVVSGLVKQLQGMIDIVNSFHQSLCLFLFH